MVHVEVLTQDVVVSPGIIKCFFLCLSVTGIPYKERKSKFYTQYNHRKIMKVSRFVGDAKMKSFKWKLNTFRSGGEGVNE